MFDLVIATLDWFGVAVFAVTGALVASRKEIYVTAALAGALVFVGGRALGLPDALGAVAGFLTCFCIRGLGLRYGLALPTYRPRPGRTAEELRRLGL